MTGLLTAVFGLAILDTLNPSAVAVTLYLLLSGGSYVRGVLAYAAGMFSSNLALGALLMLGLGSLGERLDGPAAFVAQGIIGALLLAYSILAPSGPKARAARTPRTRGIGTLFALGATVTVLEFSTALPYLGAIALLTNAGLAASRWLPVLVAYNIVFAAPPLVLLALYQAMGSRVEGRFGRWREKLASGSREAMLWVVGIVGFLLLADALARLDFFGLVDVPETPANP